MNFYRCDTTPVVDASGGLLCSSGWQQVVEPVYTLLPPGQTTMLMGAILSVVVTIIMYRLVAKAIF